MRCFARDVSTYPSGAFHVKADPNPLALRVLVRGLCSSVRTTTNARISGHLSMLDDMIRRFKTPKTLGLTIIYAAWVPVWSCLVAWTSFAVRIAHVLVE